MKLTIRMKIFLPVMLLLIAFPMAVWLIFRHVLNVHINYNAQKEMESAIAWTKDQIWTDSEEFLEVLEEAFGENRGDIGLMAVSGGYRVLFPRNYDAQEELTELYSAFLTGITEEDDSWKSGNITQQEIGIHTYLMYYQCLEAKDSQEINHVILYCPVQDVNQILEQVSGPVLLVVAVMAAVSIALFWFVAGSISGPLIRLCEAARGIGEKHFQKVETGTTVSEICLLEQEINQMQEKLQQADQAERTFFQNASHELRTPLMSISGYAQGIQCGIFDDVSQAAGVILDESTRLTEVVDGILTLTRMDQLRYQMVPVEVELHAFAKERLECLEGFALSQKKQLVFYPEGEHKLITDVMLLERAFSNVISNCIRYARRKVSISIKPYEDGAIIVIEDDGPGIRAEDAEHIFDRFHKGADGNHGLGLAIARRSLEYMGGTIRAVSKEEGAWFEIRLPADCRSFAPPEWKEL